MKASEIQTHVRAFLTVCQQEGFTYEVRGTTVSISRKFQAGSREQYAYCDMTGPGILGAIPNKGGSQWGTDGASIGGAIAIQTGRYTLNQSGCSKMFCKALLARIG
jgi:hypothetical protein